MPDQSENVARIFETTAIEHPDHIAIEFSNGSYTNWQLWRLTRAFGYKMECAGVGRGSAVSVNCHDIGTMFAALFATALLGARYVQSGDEMDVSNIVEMTHHFYTGSPQDGRVKKRFEIDSSWSPAIVEKLAEATKEFQGYAQSTDPWLIVHTSGTTGKPKFIELSHSMVKKRIDAVRFSVDEGKSKVVSLFSQINMPWAAWARLIPNLLFRGTIIDSTVPSHWIKSGATRIYASPLQLEGYLGDSVLKEKIQSLEVLGSRVLEADIKKWLTSFREIDHVYGSTETNRCYFTRYSLNDDETVSSEPFVEDETIELVDENDEIVVNGTVGNVRIKNSITIKGYLNDAEATQRFFRDGWFYPGDRAYWDASGILKIVSRSDNVLNVGGLKIMAEAVENTICEVDGIKDSVCFMNPKPNADNELLAFVVFEPQTNKLQAIASAKFKCEQKLGKKVVPTGIKEIPMVPRNEDGSPDRKKCIEAVLSFSSRDKTN